MRAPVVTRSRRPEAQAPSRIPRWRSQPRTARPTAFQRSSRRTDPCARRGSSGTLTERATAESTPCSRLRAAPTRRDARSRSPTRSEEHTSELQSQSNLVCRLLLEKKKKNKKKKSKIERREIEE